MSQVRDCQGPVQRTLLCLIHTVIAEGRYSEHTLINWKSMIPGDMGTTCDRPAKARPHAAAAAVEETPVAIAVEARRRRLQGRHQASLPRQRPRTKENRAGLAAVPPRHRGPATSRRSLSTDGVDADRRRRLIAARFRIPPADSVIDEETLHPGLGIGSRAAIESRAEALLATNMTRS